MVIIISSYFVLSFWIQRQIIAAKGTVH